MAVAAQDSSDDVSQAWADRVDPRDVDPVAPGRPDGPDGPEEAPRSRRPLVAGALGAAWALVVGVGLLACLVMLAWAISPSTTGDSAAAWRAVGLTWLGAHQVPLLISGLPVTLFPLGALLPGLLLTRRAGRWSSRLVADPSGAEVGGLVVGAAMAYGTGGAVIAWLSAMPTTGASPARAFLVSALVAAVGSLWGIARENGLVEALRARVSQATWRTLVAGVAAVAGLLTLGSVLLAVSLIAHFGDAVASLAAVSTGVVATVALTLVDILSLPTLTVWAASVAVGPGFSAGDLGHLSAFGGEVATLPALPVLAAIPASASSWWPVLLVGPVLCGVLAGRVRWRADLPTWPGALLAAGAVGAVVAPLVALAALLTSGSLGGGRLDRVGPGMLPAALAAAGLVVVGFLLEAGLQTLTLSWDLHLAAGRGVGSAAPAPDAASPDAASPDAASPDGASPDEAPADGHEGLDQPGGAGPLLDRRGLPGRTARSPRTVTAAFNSAGSAARSRMVWVATAATGRVADVAGATAGRLRPAGATGPGEPAQPGATVVAAQEPAPVTPARPVLDERAIDPTETAELPVVTAALDPGALDTGASEASASVPSEASTVGPSEASTVDPSEAPPEAEIPRWGGI